MFGEGARQERDRQEMKGGNGKIRTERWMDYISEMRQPASFTYSIAYAIHVPMSVYLCDVLTWKHVLVCGP